MEYLAKGIYPPRPLLPENWTFEEADKDFDDLIYSWRRLTLDVLIKAFSFYLVLARPGTRTDLGSNEPRLPTWEEWCKGKGVGIKTFYRHFIKLKWIDRSENSDINHYEPFEGDPDVIPADALQFLKSDLREYDLVCVDPPYNMGEHLWDQFENEENYLSWCYDWLALLYKNLKESGSIYIFGMFKMLRKISILMDQIGFTYRAYIVWDKVQGTGGGLWVNHHEDILFYTKGENPFRNNLAVEEDREEHNVRVYGGKTWDKKNPSDVWRIPVLDEKSPERISSSMTQKPLDLLERIVAGSCPIGGLALDCFAGSGSFGIACMRRKVQCVLVEKERAHVALIHRRINDENGHNKN